MDKKLYLTFLWHQHQPYYKDPSGRFAMPWVFLHAIKDYYELPWLLENTGLKATFNLVPSLIAQLKEYENPNVNDRLINLLRKDVKDWDSDEKVYAAVMLFSSNRSTMILSLPRFAEIAVIKDKNPNFATETSDDVWIDLAVCFLLSWCGNAARSMVGIAARLISKERGFTQKELWDLVDALFNFVSLIIPYHKRLQEEGKIEVATTPFYHPILPILLDKNAAVESYHDCIMPKNMADFKDDAPKHVQKAIWLYELIFNKPPNGFWPAEGSISKAALEMLCENGLKWAAGDEDVLFKSIGKTDRFELYKKHFVSTPSGDINVIFRDKRLSDLIGFAYSGKEAKEAAKDFVLKLREIYENVGFSPIVPVILDGENAWEFYPNNAFEFFKALYEELQNASWIETVTANEVANLPTPTNTVRDLQPGSWIYGTFSTWIGQEQKNKAWELLSLTKRFVDSIWQSIDDKTKLEIEQNMMIAEGSDWFWWYGDDHFTPLAFEFDTLFRLRLINIFRLGGQVAPTILYEPIAKGEAKPKYKKPSNYISPLIDGTLSDYYEWLGSGKVELGAELAAMDSSGFLLQTLYWGFDDLYIYLGLDGNFAHLIDSDCELIVKISLPDIINIKLPFSSKPYSDVFADEHGNEIGVTSCAKNYFEIKMQRKEFLNSRIMMLSFEIVKDTQLIERTPRYGGLELEVGEQLMDDWFI